MRVRKPTRPTPRPAGGGVLRLDMDSIYIVFAVVLLLAGLVGVLVPFAQCARNSQRIQRLGEAHSSGLFLAVALCHMLPSALDNWNDYQNDSGSKTDYPVVPLLVGVTFIILVSIELVQDALSAEPAPAAQGKEIGFDPRVALAMAVCFALVSPIALIIAVATGLGADPLASTFLQSAACGTFVYLTFESIGAMRGEGGHEHDIDTSSVSKAILCVAFLSAHSILDGVVIGTEDKPKGAAVLCFAISMHKVWAGMALGFKLAQNVTGESTRYEWKSSDSDLDEAMLETPDNELAMDVLPEDTKQGAAAEDVGQRPVAKKAHVHDDGYGHNHHSESNFWAEYAAFLVGFTVLALVAIVA